MRLVTFVSSNGVVRLGLHLPEGILDLTGLGEMPGIPRHPDWSSMESLLALGPEAMVRTAGVIDRLSRQAALLPLDKVSLLAPVTRPGKVICIGLNYRDHCEETGARIPEYPIIFAKFPTAITGPGLPVIKPADSSQLDYEAELAVVIGRPGKDIPRGQALDYVAGYTNFNDVSARDIQFRDKQWVRGKTYDTFAPTGPFLVTPDEITDPAQLSIKCWVNGELRQNSSTANMIFDVPALIEFVSRVVTLLPGDIIATGTPSGVGVFRKPPVFLQPGDKVRVEIEGLGSLENTIVD